MTKQAANRVDVATTIYAGKRFPCLCGDREGNAQCMVDGTNVRAFRDRAGLPIAEVECDCGKRWRRVGA